MALNEAISQVVRKRA